MVNCSSESLVDEVGIIVNNITLTMFKPSFLWTMFKLCRSTNKSNNIKERHVSFNWKFQCKVSLTQSNVLYLNEGQINKTLSSTIISFIEG